MHSALKWTKPVKDIIADYNKNSIENSQNNSVLMMGNPGTSKNYNLSVLKELLMAGDYGKVVEINASNPPELAELLQFTLPNAFFENKEVKEALNRLLEGFEENSFEKSSLAVEDVELLLEEYEDLNWNERYKELKELESEASNQQVESIVRSARMIVEDVKKKLELNYNNIKNNDDIPAKIRNALDKEGLMTGFDVAVFTPISQGMPSSVEYPEFFEPFAIPVDDYAKYPELDWGLRVIMGDANYDGYRNLYNNLVDVGESSFADMKYGRPSQERDYTETISYGGEEMEVYTPGNSTQKLNSFRKKWSSMFNNEGVICSSDFEHTLRDRLKEKLLDDETDMIILYTGFLRNRGLRKFVMTYFMETYRDLISNLENEEVDNLDKKFVTSILEAQEIVKKDDKDANLDQADKVFNRFIKEFMNASRHYNTDVWVDSKPDDAHSVLKSKVNHRFITAINHEDFREMFTGVEADFRDNVRTALTDDDYNDIDKDNPQSLGHGFFYLNEGDIEKWSNNGSETWGYRMGMKRLSLERPKKLDNISNSNFDFFNEYLGLREKGRTMKFKPYMDELFKQDWMESEKQYIDREDEKLEKRKEAERKEEKQKEEMRHEVLRSRIRAEAGNGKDVPESWTGLVKRVKNELVNKRLIEDITVDRAMTVTEDTRAELERKAQELQNEDVDSEPIVEEMTENVKFIFGATSKDMKKRHVRKWIKESDEYEINDFSDEDVKNIVQDAVAELKLDEIINNSYNPNISKEKFKEEVLGESPDDSINQDVEDDGDSGNSDLEDESEITGPLEDDESSSVEDSDEEMPDDSWSCSCGAFNGDERNVCWNCGNKWSELD